MEKINLFSEPKRFIELPKTVKVALLTLLAAWLAHFYLVFRMFEDPFSENMFLQQAALAVISFFVLLKLKNWARILCITGNVIVLIFYLFLFFTLIGGSASALLTGLALVSLALFTVSTFFLLNAESADFFKRQSAKARSSAAD